MRQRIYVNFKRFDVPASLGGVNRIADIASYGETVVRAVLPFLMSYRGVEFAHFYPEAQIPGAVSACAGSDVLKIGCQGVYRQDVSAGGSFGAFTTNRPAAAMVALGCHSTIIGHCEERKDKNELFSLTGSTDRKLVNRVLNDEVRCALNRGLDVLYCVGEQSDEMERWDEVIRTQLSVGLEGCDLSKVVVAYEPVWSIGPGKTPAGKEYIAKVARLVKETIGNVPVVYGGGLKAENAAMLASIDEIDGGLIALTRFSGQIGFYPDEYLEIIRLYMAAKSAR
ncbi:MAG: triose-phosphate isomerase [Sphaerochaetaceae bacterium]|nr:triose-phosphate isomerase [Sphaerochaetaceae bacterium]